MSARLTAGFWGLRVAAFLPLGLVCLLIVPVAAGPLSLDVRWTLGGHRLAVTGVAFSPDGTLAASSSADTTIKIWRVSDGRLMRTLTHPAGFTVDSVTFSADGTHLVTAGTGGGYLWRLSDGALVRSLCCMESGLAAAFSPDGALVAIGGSMTGSEEATLLFRVSDGAEQGRFVVALPSYVFGVAFTPEGDTLITGGGPPFSGGGTGHIRYWRLADGVETETLSDHTGRVRAISMAPDGETFISASEDRTLKLWDTGSASLIRTLARHTGEVTAAAFSPNGERLVSSSADGTLRIWDPATGTVESTLTGHIGEVSSVSWSPAGDELISGGGRLFGASGDASVRLWSVSSGTQLRKFTIFETWVEGTALSPDGRTVAVTSGDDSISLWDAGGGTLVRTIDTGSYAYDVAFSADGQVLASTRSGGAVDIWSVSSGAFIRTLTTVTSGAGAVAFSPDGRFIATGSWDTPIRIFNATDYSLIRQLTGSGSVASSLVFSPDGAFLASAANTTGVIWRVSDWTVVHSLSGHTGGILDVGYSPDGLYVATGSVDRTVKLWGAADGVLLQTLTGHGNWVQAVAFSGDGQALASGNEIHDPAIRFWSVPDGSLLGVAESTAGAGVRSVVFTPDNRMVVFVRRDATVVAAYNPVGPVPSDADDSGTIDLADYAALADCLAGPGVSPSPGEPVTAYDCLVIFDSDADQDVDLHDFATFQAMFDR